MHTKPLPTLRALARMLALAASAGLFIAACASPALLFSNAGALEPMSGFNALAVGWMGALIGQFAWFANPPYGLAMLFVALGFRRTSLALVGLALLVALDALALFSQAVPADEANVKTMTLLAFRPGFFLWIGAMLACGAGACLASRKPLAA